MTIVRPMVRAMVQPMTRTLLEGAGVPANAILVNGSPILINGSYLVVTSNG